MTSRICLVGEFEKDPDEAMRKTAQEYVAQLQSEFDVLPINASECFRPSNVRSIVAFDPDAIHFIPGPSIYSFAYTKFVGSLTDATVIHSAPHHGFHDLDGDIYYQSSHRLRKLIPALQPDKLLVQSPESKQFFEKHGVDCEYLFSGVSLDTHKPVSTDRKTELQEKYNLPVDEHLTLHVGSLKEWRNIPVLPDVIDESTQLVVVGSTATQEEKAVQRQLEAAGAIVIHEYIENIEEIYSAADLYVFPTQEQVACCDVPLTVLEAMATNLPVLTTTFGGLPVMFDEGDGLFFGDDPDQLSTKFDEARRVEEPNTREMVDPYSWSQAGEALATVYSRLS
ncbi:Glycosyltransferase involved in cell wall bisynthesis [Halomicrobium zhouii]|uniref:Glycosyltransferase involved in cell wall bisynthesis n=1 Tax=Halomicrobium zhouii TaxID=767519 RepID=A0A1I6K8A3_9EURY|nr:glycosyltransferase family 4 protein [Halomicrobium zhouii]SFR87493.1 Glycosyltransferase involved in cell wall bisynthesis [Halomicrobium zhouii]